MCSSLNCSRSGNEASERETETEARLCDDCAMDVAMAMAMARQWQRQRQKQRRDGATQTASLASVHGDKHTHTHTQRDAHTYAGLHTCDLAGRMYSLNELLSVYTEPRLQFSAFGFHFLFALLLSFCLFWAWLSSDVS